MRYACTSILINCDYIYTCQSQAMKIVLQRVKQAKVTHEKSEISSIKNGYVLLIGFERNDKQDVIDNIIKKILKAKLFNDWTKSIVDMEYEILCLSQFTLFAVLRGTKPDFHLAEDHNTAKELFEYTNNQFCKNYKSDLVKKGLFGKHLEIELVNDGPVTIIFDKH